MKLSGLAWWDAMADVQKQIGQRRFREWLLKKVRRWSVRLRVADMMAWNDHNSDYYLFRDHIKKTGTYSDGTPVDAESIVVNVLSML